MTERSRIKKNTLNDNKTAEETVGEQFRSPDAEVAETSAIKKCELFRVLRAERYSFEDKKSETFEYQDKDPATGFVLLPEIYVGAINMESLYLYANVSRKDIISIRDLNSSLIDYWAKYPENN
ncbi:hypothetical protein G9P44_000977 [Scheffersomyces stipitis]|nr:hypothetical protein G9P44_000977 [Scheffersomyces stipitis]